MLTGPLVPGGRRELSSLLMWPRRCPAPEASAPVMRRFMGRVVSLGPQAACPLRETEDTIAEGNRAGSWKMGCKRNRAPEPQGTPELSLGNDTEGA